ncbi:MAG: type II toxin-antitoxin system PemK/MazF family toxin [Clostridia bacterium]|nr:type II toxin-antitoxin system PemK/MazF family toxin [Clostridia bacterium]
MDIKCGDIFYADLSPVVGSEQDGIRPVLIVQNDIGNKYSPTIIALAITSRQKTKLPTHIPIAGNLYGLPKDSVILAEQIRTLDKSRLQSKIGRIDKETMDKVKSALKVNFSLRMDIDSLFNDWED